jgi:hypothetical protein
MNTSKTKTPGVGHNSAKAEHEAKLKEGAANIAALQTAITAAASSIDKAEGKMVLVADAAHAAGVKAAMFRAPPKGVDKNGDSAHALAYQAIRKAIIAGLPKADQRILALETRSLSEAEKADKRERILPKVSAIMGSLRKAVERREAAGEDGEGKGANKRTNDVTYISERLTAIDKRLDKIENPPFDVVLFRERIRACAAILTIKV